MQFLLWVGAAIVALCVLMLIRNELVYRIRCRRIDWAFQVAPKYHERVRQFQSVSYEAMLYDLRKWTYNQFYGAEE